MWGEQRRRRLWVEVEDDCDCVAATDDCEDCAPADCEDCATADCEDCATADCEDCAAAAAVAASVAATQSSHSHNWPSGSRASATQWCFFWIIVEQLWPVRSYGVQRVTANKQLWLASSYGLLGVMVSEHLWLEGQLRLVSSYGLLRVTVGEHLWLEGWIGMFALCSTGGCMQRMW